MAPVGAGQLAQSSERMMTGGNKATQHTGLFLYRRTMIRLRRFTVYYMWTTPRTCESFVDDEGVAPGLFSESVA